MISPLDLVTKVTHYHVKSVLCRFKKNNMFLVSVIVFIQFPVVKFHIEFKDMFECKVAM